MRKNRGAAISVDLVSRSSRKVTYCVGLFSALRRRAIKPTLFAYLILICPALARAQQPPKQSPPGIGNLESVVVNGDTLTLHVGEDTVMVQVVEPNILRVHYSPQGQTSPPTLVLDPNVTWRNDTPAKIDTGSDPMVISTEKMTVRISKKPVRFEIYDASNRLLLQEPSEGGVYKGGLRFAHKSTDPFFGIDGTSLAGENIDPRQDIRTGVRRSGGTVGAAAREMAGLPLCTRPHLACSWIPTAETSTFPMERSSSPAARAKTSNTSRLWAIRKRLSAPWVTSAGTRR